MPDVGQARWFVDHVLTHETALRVWLRSRFPWLTEVDDVARDAVLRLWARRVARGAIGSPKAMLFSMARNAACDIGRRRGVVEMDSVAEIDLLPVLDESVDVVESVSTREELEFLADAIRQLPDGCRQVLTLCKLYGYPPKEIAAELGISVHTVRAQIAKGMRSCAAHLCRRGVRREKHERR